MGVERFEVEVFDWLRGERVKRPIPDYETLELADPRDALGVERVLIRGLGEPALARRLAAGSLGILTEEDLKVLDGMPGVHYEDPRYLYVLLHALGCRKLAFLLLGTKPLDEEEEALRDVAVVDVPPVRGRYRLGPRVRPVRAVFFTALPDPFDVPEEEMRGDPLLRGVLRLEVELEVLGRVAELAALASGEYVPYLPQSPAFYVRALWLARALRRRESLREALARAGVQLGELSVPQPWSKVLERVEKRRAATPLERLQEWLRPRTPEEEVALKRMSELRRAARLCLSAHGIPDDGAASSTSYIVLGLFNALSMRDTVLVKPL
jgi:hypothetical protein